MVCFSNSRNKDQVLASKYYTNRMEIKVRLEYRRLASRGLSIIRPLRTKLSHDQIYLFDLL